MPQSSYILHTELIKQKFFKPTLDNEYIVFEDNAVHCPNKNNYSSNKNKISVTAVCFDCSSFEEWIGNYEGIICKGNPKFNKNEFNNFKDFLDPIEIEITN